MFVFLLQLLDCFGSLLERVVIRENFEHKLPLLIEIVEQELDGAKVSQRPEGGWPPAGR
jgi:hypothetical protein